MTAAIYFHPEAFTTSGPKLMGRNAAGESFLRGFLQYGNAGDLWVQVSKVEHAQHFADVAVSFGRTETVRAVLNNNLAPLSQPGVLYFPGPSLIEHAWQRTWWGHASWSLCGITHTTSSATAMDSITQFLTAPIQPWDILICTSTAVKDNVTRLLQAQADYLAARLGCTRLPLPLTPVIPLGIHTDDFSFTEAQRSAARAALGIDPTALVVLYMGRLSFHAKAHPLAMYQALQLASERTNKNIVLIECGWHANPSIADAFAEGARIACPSVHVLTLDGRIENDRQMSWAAADIFCSLSDNIQETFGIVPIEGMAAGLPVVVSDWDGYRDTVRDGVDGFRVPTAMPPAGMAIDLAQRHAQGVDSYDMYCGHACTLVAVDVDAAAQAFVRLFQSPELRKQMGASGRERARAMYDWRVIIPQYESVWARAAELRKAENSVSRSPPHPWPARMDPFHSFASYPTKALTLDTQLELVDASVDRSIARVRDFQKLAMVSFAQYVYPSDDEIKLILQAASSGVTGNRLIEIFPDVRRGFVFRSVAWLLKLHILRSVN